MNPNAKGAFRKDKSQYMRANTTKWVENKREHERAAQFYAAYGLPLPDSGLDMTIRRPPVPNNPRVADAQIIGDQMYRPPVYENLYGDARIGSEHLNGVHFDYSEQAPMPAAARMYTPQAEIENRAIAGMYETAGFNELALPGPLTGAPDPAVAEGWRTGPGTAPLHGGTGLPVGVPFQADTGGSEALLAFGAPVNFQPMMPPVSQMEVPAPSEMAAGGGTPGNSRA